jgi:pimeloyl-CoA synthetase
MENTIATQDLQRILDVLRGCAKENQKLRGQVYIHKHWNEKYLEVIREKHELNKRLMMALAAVMAERVN